MLIEKEDEEKFKIIIKKVNKIYKEKIINKLYQENLKIENIKKFEQEFLECINKKNFIYTFYKDYYNEHLDLEVIYNFSDNSKYLFFYNCILSNFINSFNKFLRNTNKKFITKEELSKKYEIFFVVELFVITNNIPKSLERIDKIDLIYI